VSPEGNTLPLSAVCKEAKEQCCSLQQFLNLFDSISKNTIFEGAFSASAVMSKLLICKLFIYLFKYHFFLFFYRN